MSNDPTTMRLSHGAHDTREEGVCLLEAVAWLAGEPHSDAPTCASVVLSAYGRALNDILLPGRTELEPRLRALAPRLVGTAGRPDLDQRAGLMAADWLIRVYVPAWLRLAGLTGHADTLESGGPIRFWDSLPTAGLVAAYSAARDAADSAAGDAVSSAIRSVAYSAAHSAAYSAVRIAADSAARSAAWDAPSSEASIAAYSAAYSAAWSAAESAAYSAAAKDVLAPTVRELQDSALDLYERMIALWRVHDDSR